MPKDSQGRDHTREIFGIIFLAIGSFVALCLYSYHPLDPSFTSTGSGDPIRNFGGIMGSYLADLLYAGFGVGAYFVPTVLVLVSFSYFALKPVRAGWLRILGFFTFVSLSAILCQLVLKQVALRGHPMEAGGIVGWVGVKIITRYAGLVGAYLFSVAGFVLTVIWLTEISVTRIFKFASDVARELVAKSVSLSRLWWARLVKKLARQRDNIVALYKKWREKREKKPTKIPETPARVIVKKPATDHEPKPAADKSSDDPAVIPRKDLGDKIRPQMGQLRIVSLDGSFELPQLSYLDSGGEAQTKPVDEKSLKMNAHILENKLKDFGVEGHVVAIHPGPVITMYEFEPAPGIKVGKITNLADDLSVTMGGKSVRIVPHLPGKAAIGIEIPNNDKEIVWLRDIIGHAKFQRSESKLTLAMGKDREGTPMVTDLTKMPHLLIAGATGSGKSVCLNSIICSILYKARPDEVRLILVDPKMLELSVYADIPHLLLPVITDPKKVSQSLRWAVREMDRRYHLMVDAGMRNIVSYNKKIESGGLDRNREIVAGRETLHHEGKLPFVVIIIDELADLMMTCSKDLEENIIRLSQKARAAGIHLIFATQRPSVDIITGIIKANFPARISFKVSSRHDSRTILDQIGSERLLGFGDMLFMSPHVSGLLRMHGAFVTESEIHRVVDHLKKQGKPAYREEILRVPIEDETGENGTIDEEDKELYDRAVGLVTQTGQASISMIQRHLRIGYNRAARMIEQMESEGVIGPADGIKPREVLARNLSAE